MTRVDPSRWAKAVADALYVGGERIPFERVLQQHLTEVDTLRNTGLTWQSLAQCLLRAGVRRPNAQPYSADHLRVCCQRRLARVEAKSVPASRKSREGSSAAGNTAIRMSSSDTARRADARRVAPRPMPSSSEHEAEDKDVSIEDLAAVRARLQTFR